MQVAESEGSQVINRLGNIGHEQGFFLRLVTYVA